MVFLPYSGIKGRRLAVRSKWNQVLAKRARQFSKEFTNVKRSREIRNVFCLPVTANTIPIYRSVIWTAQEQMVFVVELGIFNHTHLSLSKSLLSALTLSMGPHHLDLSWRSVAYTCLTPCYPFNLCPTLPFADPILRSKETASHLPNIPWNFQPHCLSIAESVLSH